MRLIRADGHKQQQWALANEYTQTIARILSEHIDDDATLLREIAQILQKFDGEAYDDLDQRLATIRAFYELNDLSENIPDYIVELLEALRNFYYQSLNSLFQKRAEQINSLRGAVLERLCLELVKPRYDKNDECANSRRFVDQHDIIVTKRELDLAAISTVRRQLEGYECKIKSNSFVDQNRWDLRDLYDAASKEEYQAQVGIISLDTNKAVERRLRWLQADPCIQAFGIDTLDELRYSPFDG